jgi:hypothetical protein
VNQGKSSQKIRLMPKRNYNGSGAALSAKNPIDRRFQIAYEWKSEWQFEGWTAAVERAAVAQRGSRVLIPSRGFLQPHCPTAVGFLFCQIEARLP